MANKGMSLPAEVFNQDEIDRFLETFTDSARGLRNKCIFLLALRCQMRCNEITHLRTSDIDANRGCVTIIRGKGGKRRVVGCDSDTMNNINEYLKLKKSRPEPQPGENITEQSPLFVSNRGKHLDNSYVRKLAKRHGILAGIGKRVSPHNFRHTGACILMEKGIDIRIIQRQLGHSSLAVTDRYLNHLGANQVVETVRDLSW